MIDIYRQLVNNYTSHGYNHSGLQPETVLMSEKQMTIALDCGVAAGVLSAIRSYLRIERGYVFDTTLHTVIALCDIIIAVTLGYMIGHKRKEAQLPCFSMTL